MRAEIDRRAMGVLAAGHLAVDFAGGALPALLPFLKDKFGLSYTLVAVITLASALSGSVIQPLFGLWSDRRGAYWLMPIGVGLAGIGMGIAAASPHYWLVVLFVIASGLGTAAFHPEGSKFAAYASGRRRASGMSIFAVGGNVGYGLGALVATPLVLWIGLKGGLLIAVPCAAVALGLLALAPFLGTFVPERDVSPRAPGEDQPWALAILLTIVAFRSTAWFGLVTFVPLWERSLGHSEAHGGHLLSLMLLVGAIGALVAGAAADRFGRRAVLIVSNLVSPPLILIFVVVGGIPGAFALALVGIAIIGTFGVTMVMSQEYLPRRIGLASGLSIGLSIGLGGIAAVVLGAIADAIDLRTAFYVCAAAPGAALALCVFLPSGRIRAQLAPEVVSP